MQLYDSLEVLSIPHGRAVGHHVAWLVTEYLAQPRHFLRIHRNREAVRIADRNRLEAAINLAGLLQPSV